MPLRRKITLHAALWLLLFGILIFDHVIDEAGRTPFRLALVLEISFLGRLVLFAYFNYGLLRWGLKPGRYPWLVLSLLGSLLAAVAVRYLVEERFLGLWGMNNYFSDTTFWHYVGDNVSYYSLPPFLMAFLFKAIDEFVFREQIQREKLTTELLFLKSQVNPHFLFNTLNNIYALTLAKSDAAPGAVLKLAELMRYMLYEASGETVELAGEVRYLQSFVELQRMRYHGETFVDFEVHGQLNGQRIAPLLLIPFVENAFKHGDVQNPASPLRIRVAVHQHDLSVEVENRKKGGNKDELGGVGLGNVRRRLALLYPQRHSLDVQDGRDHYRSELNLMLE
ncbi:MAG: histidine kinase [Sphingobacteriaceae bacterium]|nr:histidine kinase [Cytophagaceae bacterium]